MNKLTATDIWRDQIERPEEVDEAIVRLHDVIGFLRKKVGILRRLRKLSVGVYGEPTFPEPPPREPDPFEPLDPLIPPGNIPEPPFDPFEPPGIALPDPEDVPPEPDDSSAAANGAPWHGWPASVPNSIPHRGSHHEPPRPLPDDVKEGKMGKTKRPARKSEA